MVNNNSFLATMIGIIVATCVLNSIIKQNNIKENFLMFPLTPVSVQDGAEPGRPMQALEPNYQRMVANPPQNALRALQTDNAQQGMRAPKYVSESFTKTPNTLESFYGTSNFQGMLSPRFDSNGYSGNIKYNMPSEQYMAAPKNPLDFGNLVVENYPTTCQSGGNCAPKTCGGVKNGKPFPNVAVGNSMDSANAAGATYQNALNAVNMHNGLPQVVDSLPAQNMTNIGTNGSEKQVYVVDRFMWSPTKSRLWKGSDPIRGDLPIVPMPRCAYAAWGVPSVVPSRDLRTGSLAMINGDGSSTTSDRLNALKQITSAGVTPSYDINYSLNNPNTVGTNVSRQYNVSQGDGAVQYTAFN